MSLEPLKTPTFGNSNTKSTRSARPRTSSSPNHPPSVTRSSTGRRTGIDSARSGFIVPALPAAPRSTGVLFCYPGNRRLVLVNIRSAPIIERVLIDATADKLAPFCSGPSGLRELTGGRSRKFRGRVGVGNGKFCGARVGGG